MNLSSNDTAYMRLALDWAERALYLTSPNPRVGCVLVVNDQLGGEVIGQGHTQAAGQAHAEVMALRDAAAKGRSTQGATAYVTLEPCAHHGRTPPCFEALLAAGVSRVVCAGLDPNPLVAGKGLAGMRAAGVDVQVLPPQDPLALEARALNIGFFSRMQRSRPWVRLKIAATLDGYTALPNGESQWITGAAARDDGHHWRARACAVLTGIGTVRKDDPQLNVRGVATPRQPQRVVLDARLEMLQLQPQPKLLQAPLHALESLMPTWVYHGDVPNTQEVGKSAAQSGSQTQAAPSITLSKDSAAKLIPTPLTANGKIELAPVLLDLGRRGINELHVEAGGKLNAAWLQAGLVDEVLLYTAPRVMGYGALAGQNGTAATGHPMLPLPLVGRLADMPQLHVAQAAVVGNDVRLNLLTPQGAAFLKA